jgi:hypothetical protein
MTERHRNHLIFVKTNQDPETHLWTASAHVQFNEDLRTFRDVWLPRPTARFETEAGAEKHMVNRAKEWIDDRIGIRERQTPLKVALQSLRRWLLAALPAINATVNFS